MDDVIKTRQEGGIYEVTLDRPKANAIDLVTSRKMGEIFKHFRDKGSWMASMLRHSKMLRFGSAFF